MKIKIKKEVDVKYLEAICGVRYWEDAEVNGVEDEDGSLIPCREYDYWRPFISIENGKIVNWEPGTTAKIHYKVCDDGKYILKDADSNEVTRIEGYVPQIMCPKENGYGDYVIMDVDEDGCIEDWEPILDEFNS